MKMKALSPKILGTIFIFLISLILFSYHLLYSFNFDSDFGRDLCDMLTIVKGKFRLVGPKLSFGGLFIGPYYYYLFVPFLFLSKLDPGGIIVANALLFSLSLSIFFYLFSRKASLSFSLLASLWLATSSYFIFSARNPGNAFSYLPFLLVFFVLFEELIKSENRLVTFGFGFLAGVIVNFHFVNLLIFLPLFLILLLLQKKKFKLLLFLFLGFGASFLPLCLFEIRHNFIMLKNTFVYKSYQTFIQKGSLPTALEVSSNPLENLFLILRYINQWSVFDVRVQIAFILLFLVMNFRKIEFQEKIPALSLLLSFCLLIFVARFQLAFHYLFPFILFIQYVFLSFLGGFKKAWVLVFILLILNLTKFPLSYYQQSKRNYQDFKTIAKQIIESNFIGQRRNFNVFVARKTPLAVLGWEYRYFLKVLGYEPDLPEQYRQSEKLLLISERGEIDWRSLKSWEISEFGELKEPVLSGQFSGRTVYLFKK